MCLSIASSVQVDISPLELAIETVENKNREIATLTTACLENVAFNLQSLTMILSGVIDAAVNGGIDNYRKVRLSPFYLPPLRTQHALFVAKLCADWICFFVFQIFFTPSYLEDFPQQEGRVKHLQKLIEDQVRPGRSRWCEGEGCVRRGGVRGRVV